MPGVRALHGGSLHGGSCNRARAPLTRSEPSRHADYRGGSGNAVIASNIAIWMIAIAWFDLCGLGCSA
jgi:hypothetical protein